MPLNNECACAKIDLRRVELNKLTMAEIHAIKLSALNDHFFEQENFENELSKPCFENMSVVIQKWSEISGRVATETKMVYVTLISFSILVCMDG